MSQDTNASTANGSHSAQWGLASILIGSLVLVGWPIGMGLLFGSLVAIWHSDMLESSVLDLGVVGGWVLIGGVSGLALVGLLCGVTGLAAAKSHGQPRGLSVAGTLVSLVAVAAMVVFFLGALQAAEWIRWLQKERYEKGIQYPVKPHKP